MQEWWAALPEEKKDEYRLRRYIIHLQAWLGQNRRYAAAWTSNGMAPLTVDQLVAKCQIFSGFPDFSEANIRWAASHTEEIAALAAIY
jgi:hypothetical protein